VRHLPNLICIIRIILVWPIAVALREHQYLQALGLFMVAGLSDGLDGFLAKHFGWQSELGKFLDPLADKLLLMTVFIESAWMGLTPWWLTAAVVTRDVLIGSGALVYRLWIGQLHGHPSISSKLNTAMQLLYPVALFVNAAVGFPPHEVLDALSVIVFVTTVVSGGNYVAMYTRRAMEHSVSQS
jgi:cardiolipin synthase (CMP-forming)